jgi:hypothetical protein
MKDLKKLWAELDSSFDGPVITQKQLELKSRVDNPVSKLRSNFRANLIMAGLCSLLMGAIFIFFDGFWIRLLVGIILVGYAGAIWQTTWLYNRYLKNLYPDDDIRSYLKNLHKTITEGLRYQEIIAIFFYPVSLAAGYFLSLFERGETEAFFTEPFYWILLLVVIVVLTPLLYLLSKWLYNISFRKYLRKIEAILREIDGDVETKTRITE